MRPRILLLVVISVSFAWGAAPTLARWHLVGVSRTSIAYNQGLAFDGARRFLFDGVVSITNSGVYRTDSSLRVTAANTSMIPKTTEGYNHAGDLTYDPVGRRILLPLECYYPNAGGNTCGTGAIGAVDPVTLRFRYYVNLARSQIKKAMWDEIGPDGRWIWTSSGNHLLAYRATKISQDVARRQRSGQAAGIIGVDLGPVLPGSGVTGAAFYRDPRSRTVRLFLSLNLGPKFVVISFRTTTTGNGRPKLLSPHPSTIISLTRSTLNNEPEGLAITPASRRGYPLGGLLHWQTLPAITPSTAFSRILTFLP